MPRILIIEDDRAIRGLLRTLLEEDGFTVEEAANGRLGVAQFRSQAADLVLCDIFMDEQDGLGTIRMLRAEFPKVKIIAMSGGGHRLGADFLKTARFLGATAALPKPISRAELLEAVHQVLRPSEEPPAQPGG